jgi:glycosyltransferase involved in cell wall biosynthesis
MKKRNKAVFIFWGANSPPSEDFAKSLNAAYHKIHYLQSKRALLAPIRYIPMFLKTLWVLYKEHPSVVFVVNTPVFAPLCVWLYCRLADIPFVMDIHGHSFCGWKWAWCAPLQRILARHAMTNMIDHSEHLRIFNSWGAKISMMERPPIKPPSTGEKLANASNRFVVTLINTFAGDEPLEQVVKAANSLPDMLFFILGDATKAKKSLIQEAADNVIFPGYLLSDRYWTQLYSSNVIMTLTNTPFSLVAGGIEGMSVGKPLILSRQPALTDYFTKGTIFVEHSVESIVDAVKQTRAQEDHLKEEIAKLAIEKRERWNSERQKLFDMIGAHTCKTSKVYS